MIHSKELWENVNRELIAKAISELHYENILEITEESNKYFLYLDQSITYSFNATKTIWGQLIIETQTISKNNNTELSAAIFFIDTKKQHQMDDITLSHFLFEMNQTLYSEIKRIKEIENQSIDTVLNNSMENLKFINGHPKILLNKGRIGFSSTDLNKYSPEESKGFKLFWVAIAKDLDNLKFGELSSSTSKNELKNHLSNKDLDKLKEIDLNKYFLVPLHPWQWDHWIKIQSQELIYNQKIIFIGELEEEYLPQISIRTVSPINKAINTELKLTLNILNTSAYRGISHENISLGPKLSNTLSEIIQKDNLLLHANTSLLKEIFSLSFLPNDFGKIKNAPYRFHEYFGFILRERAESLLKENETYLMTGNLFSKDLEGNSLIGTLIKKSKINEAEWIVAYTQKVILPLYHLQLKYGIGLVAHGQNVILKLKNNIPSGIIIKDFQGDLRISTNSPLSSHPVLSNLKQLPPEYLIHDLITGHFITVVRFFSYILEEEKIIAEADFYKIMSKTICHFLQENHPNIDFNSPLSLVRENFERVILNKVRFKMGYQDTSERLLPMLGNPLNNPMSSSLLHREGSYEK